MFDASREIIRRTWSSALVLLIVTGAGYGIIMKHVTVGADRTVHVSSDVLAFVQAGKDLVAGRDIYHNDDGSKNSYVYPPFWACVTALLTWLPPLLVDAGWYILNIWLILPVLAMSYRLFTGQNFLTLARRERWTLGALSVLFSLRYIVRNAQDANINMVILFLIVAGAYLTERPGRQGGIPECRPAGAGLVGIAAAIKILPLVFIVWYAARGKWKEAAYLLGAFAAATLLPVIVTGFPALVHSLGSFITYSRTQFGPAGIEIENFSLWGTLGRLFSHSVAFEYPDGHPVFVNIMAASPATIKFLTVALSGGILGAVWGATLDERKRTGNGATGIRMGSFALMLVAMNLVSILTEDHHPVGLLVVYLYLIILWKRGAAGGIPAKLLIAGSGLFAILVSYDVVVPLAGKFGYMVLLALGLPVLPVEITLFFLLLREQRPTSPTVSRTS
jgi:hypothetical protein